MPGWLRRGTLGDRHEGLEAPVGGVAVSGTSPADAVLDELHASARKGLLHPFHNRSRHGQDAVVSFQTPQCNNRDARTLRESPLLDSEERPRGADLFWFHHGGLVQTGEIARFPKRFAEFLGDPLADEAAKANAPLPWKLAESGSSGIASSLRSFQ
jgi:hypothetical protein